jgi:hydroxymethylglutaryl-CoA reductase
MTVSFRHLTQDERHEYLKTHCSLTDEEVALLKGAPLPGSIADHLIENSVGYFQIPMGIATHFRIDGKDRLIPMVVEETSIIAAASAMAKWVRTQGELTTRMQGKLIIGQIQFPRVKSAEQFKALLQPEIPSLIEMANRLVPGLVNRGGGVREIKIRELKRPDDGQAMMVLHILCDPCDAMGANLINQVCEALKPEVARITRESVGLCILSNLVDDKLAIADVVIKNVEPEIAEGICEAALFAHADPYRAATHNKGILNGIDPILIATGNDWRAVEAGVHAYAARSGSYQPLTRWWREGSDLRGQIELPMAVGTAGGVTKIHPMAKLALKILGVEKAEELARISAAVGLIQNLGALKALSTVGIVRGHMELHASNLALAAGSTEEEVVEVKSRLTEMLKNRQGISISAAQEVLREIRARANAAIGATSAAGMTTGLNGTVLKTEAR